MELILIILGSLIILMVLSMFRLSKEYYETKDSTDPNISKRAKRFYFLIGLFRGFIFGIVFVILYFQFFDGQQFDTVDTWVIGYYCASVIFNLIYVYVNEFRFKKYYMKKQKKRK